MKTALKLGGVALGLVGIVATFAHHRGCFRDPQRQRFADTIMSTEQPIPRSTPGFEDFLASFPPPRRVATANVTHIADKVLLWNSRSDVGISIAYIANGNRTTNVARFDEIESWVQATSYGWLSLAITFAGWALYAAVEILELLQSWRQR